MMTDMESQTTMAKSELILASQSPRRIELLKTLGIPFRAIPHRFTETLPQGVDPKNLATRLSLGKAESLSGHYPTAIIIGSDTLVCVGDTLLGKPTSRTHAFSMLRQLSGQIVTVISGVAIVRGNFQKCAEGVETKLRFKDLSDQEIEAYIHTGEPDDKAGAFAVQGKGRALISEIDGDFENVVGLPTAILKEMLRSFL